jgi:hypothetical protein
MCAYQLGGAGATLRRHGGRPGPASTLGPPAPWAGQHLGRGGLAAAPGIHGDAAQASHRASSLVTVAMFRAVPIVPAPRARASRTASSLRP